LFFLPYFIIPYFINKTGNFKKKKNRYETEKGIPGEYA